MASLENLYHDFPRLAKQSGFHFQLHKGKVNWSEIENLDLNDIIENENYKLLEQNLINVVNCNLEKEYDLKILDQNFVKLIKLAQLGVDYLSYFEIYLDKCVILLQEQLVAFKEECDSLKRKESKKIKKKKKTQIYQCEKCEKVFISDVYLKFHEKRRHSNPNMFDKSHKKSLSNDKKNEERKQFSISTQTLFLDKMLTVTNEHENENSLIKIKKLEQEMQELKERLKKAENTLTVKPEASNSNEFSSLNITDAKQYDSILLFLPFYLPQLNDSFEKINSECQTSTPKVPQPNCTISNLVKSETFNNEPVPGNFSHISSESENRVEKEKVETKLILPTESFDSFRKVLKEEIKILSEKENASRNTEKDLVTYLNKPLPAPRKLRKEFEKQIRTESEREGFCKTSRKEIEDCSNFSTPDKSTQMKNPNEENISDISEEGKNSFSKIKKSEANSFESLDSQKSVSTEPQFKSFIKKIVTNSSPKLRKICENIKKSLNSRNDSVSIIGKKDSDNVNLRTVVEGINNRLRRLGVDPEWSGIPKKTMKQKLSVLKHRRRVLSKANPMYFVVRQNVEKKIFQKLKTSLEEKKTVLTNKFNDQRSVNIKSQPSENAVDKYVSEFVKIESSALNNINTDSDSMVSGSEKNFGALHRTLVEEKRSLNDPEKKIQSKKDTEFDFSVFQVGKALNTTTNEKKDEKKCKKIKERGADSDSESDFSDDLNFKTLNISSNDQQSQIKNFNTAKYQLEFSRRVKENEGQCKVGEEVQSRLSINAQKRFFVASYPNDIEELTDSPTDDFRPLKSDWEKDLGRK